MRVRGEQFAGGRRGRVRDVGAGKFFGRLGRLQRPEGLSGLSEWVGSIFYQSDLIKNIVENFAPSWFAVTAELKSELQWPTRLFLSAFTGLVAFCTGLLVGLTRGAYCLSLVNDSEAELLCKSAATDSLSPL